MAGFDSLQGLRLLPINQAAAIKLRAAGVVANEEAQQVFQLMEWGIASDPRHRYQDIAGELTLLQSVDQQAALDYLLTNIPGGVPGMVRTLLRADARTAAKVLLGLLDMRLKTDPKLLPGQGAWCLVMPLRCRAPRGPRLLLGVNCSVSIVPTLLSGYATRRNAPASITEATPMLYRVPSHLATRDAGASLAAYPRWSVGTMTYLSGLTGCSRIATAQLKRRRHAIIPDCRNTAFHVLLRAASVLRY
jgi:hypothetical protein